jgi:hypothetical protein
VPRLTFAVPNPGSVTSDSEEIKQILFEFQSGLCKQSDSFEGFDPNFFAETLDITSNYPITEVGQPICESSPSFLEVKNSIDSLVNHKAAGLDLLFNECLKHGGPSFMHIFDNSF